ncbi:MAG: hypothetical protein M9921_01840 [Fimbriimonadaceae bacterium]|nr:hypothetical protein [Chthonomonadaceae bacterium]MCO5295578.1 hypothetical protein [Fimbriimonadaceae bacterium]
MKVFGALALVALILAGCAANHTKEVIQLVERAPKAWNSGKPDAQLRGFLESVQKLQSYDPAIVAIALKSARDPGRDTDPFAFQHKLHLIVRTYYEVPVKGQGPWVVEEKEGTLWFTYPKAILGAVLSPAEEFAQWQGKYPKRDLAPLLK